MKPKILINKKKMLFSKRVRIFLVFSFLALLISMETYGVTFEAKKAKDKQISLSQENGINCVHNSQKIDDENGQKEERNQLNQEGKKPEKRKERETKKPETEEKPKNQEANFLFRFHEEIVVTATPLPTSLKNCPISTSVVSREILNSLNVSNALNALLFEPGVFIMRTGDFGRSDLEIRGLGQRGQRIGLMVDGRPEKMGLFGCIVTQTFPLDNVDKIEIVRGPASVFYGSDALGGMINLITRTPDQGYETEASGAIGSFKTRRLTLRHGAGFEKIKYYLTYDSSQSDGHIANSAYSAQNFTGKIKAVPSSHWQLIFSGKYYDGIKHEPTINWPTPPEANWFKYRRGAFDLNLKGSPGPFQIDFRLYTNFGQHRFANGWNSKDNIYGSLFKTNFSLAKANSLTLGADLRQLEGQSFHSPRGQWSRQEGGFFIYDEHVFSEKLIASAGFRLNFDSVYGLETASTAALLFSLRPETLLRVLISKGFRSPQLNELYLFPASNPNLKPEKIWNYELGLNHRVGKFIDFSLNLFLMRGFDFIENRKNPSPPPAFKMMNIGQYRAKGIESILYAYLGNYGLGRISLTYLDPGEKTQGKAGQKYDITLIFRRGKLFAAINGQYVTDYYAGDRKSYRLPSFFLVNLKEEINLTRFLSISLSLDNILNEKYSLYVNLPEGAGIYPMPGRAIYFGLKIKP